MLKRSAGRYIDRCSQAVALQPRLIKAYRPGLRIRWVCGGRKEGIRHGRAGLPKFGRVFHKNLSVVKGEKVRKKALARGGSSAVDFSQ